MDKSLEFINQPFNRILIDWVSFTSKIHSVGDIVDLIGLRGSPFETVAGSKGFSHRMYWNGVSIHYCTDKENLNYGWVWLEMSGQGCRVFETHGHGDYSKIFQIVLDHPDDCRLTRLDVAYDDTKGVLDIDQICDQTRQEHFTARSKVHEAIYSNKGNSAYFGSKSSNVLIRFYDKAKERGYSEDQIEHWVRCELQLKDVNAFGFVRKLDERSLQDLYSGVLRNYLSFKDENPGDSNKRRWPESDWWTQFLDGAVPISVYSKPGVDYNLSACERYVYSQPIGSLQTLIKIYGAPAVVASIMSCPPPKNPKYQRLIADYELHQSEDPNAQAEKFIRDLDNLSLAEKLDLNFAEIEEAAYTRSGEWLDRESAQERYKAAVQKELNQMSYFNKYKN